MTNIILNNLSKEFGLDFQIIKSWIDFMGITREDQAKTFFKENIKIINAKPFIKWVGGKRQILPKFQELFPKDFNNYFEPFLGGGAVFFNIQKNKSFLSDINLELINTYNVVKNKPNELIEFLKTCKYEKDFYTKIRSWDREDDFLQKYSEIQRAGRFLYLNRTCFNGLYRVNSKGQFNVPMGKYKNPDFVQEENIINTSKLLNKVKADIKLQSFEKVLDKAKSGDFVYFDPPYDTLTDTANFTSYNESGFGQDMQIKLRDVCKKLDDKLLFFLFKVNDLFKFRLSY